MIYIKSLLLLLILISLSLIGITISKKYVNRVSELKELKNSLEIFKTKIKFTGEPIPDIFEEISNQSNSCISNIFKKSTIYMKTETAGSAWKKAISNSNTSLVKEDLDVLYNFSKLLR